MKKSLVFFSIPTVIFAASCRQNQSDLAQREAPRQGIRGELIDMAPAAPAAPPPQTSTNTPPKNRHPKPPSVQRRMVQAELVMSAQSNYDSAALPSGTAGTAADLAKTNLPSVTSLAGPAMSVPGYENVTFDILSGFDFTLTQEVAGGAAGPDETAAKARAQIPAKVQSLDGKDVVIQGFLLPVLMNNGLAVEFLLMRNQSMCCYGVPPKINEWITVRVTGRGIKPVMDQPITVAGTLHVGPIEENGSLAGIYSLDATKVLAPF